MQVARRKFRVEAAVAAARARTIAGAYRLWPSNVEIVGDALQIVERHSLRIFDAVIVATAANARCDLIVSEDMQDGFTWNGVTVSNPFTLRPDARIAPFLPAASP